MAWNMLSNPQDTRRITRPSVLIVGGLPAANLPATGECPALARQAQALARDHHALVIAWPHQHSALITLAAPPLGLVAGGLGLLLPPDELVVEPNQAAEIARVLAELLEQPTAERAEIAHSALACVATPEAELWRVVIAGWGAALTRSWERLEQTLQQAYALADQPAVPPGTLAGTLLALGVLSLEAGEPAGQAGVWFQQAAANFAALGQAAQAGLARWGMAQALERQGLAAEARGEAAAALEMIDAAEAPVTYALVLAGVASLWHAHAQGAEEQRQARAQLSEAVQACSPGTAPLLAARLLASLGDAYQDGVDAELRQALECYQRAEELFERAGTPEDLAAVWVSQATAWQGLGGDSRGHLRQAIDQYHSALRTFTIESYPAEYALIHNNMATAYLKMPLSGEHDIMRQALAVQSLQEALKVYTFEDYPREYAMVQNNLGNTLQFLPSGDRVEKLDRAIGAYQEALRVRSRQRSPVEYATTLSNLANAYANLPAAERRETLELAARCYAEALEIFRAHAVGDQAQVVEQALEVVLRDLVGE